MNQSVKEMQEQELPNQDLEVEEKNAGLFYFTKLLIPKLQKVHQTYC